MIGLPGDVDVSVQVVAGEGSEAVAADGTLAGIVGVPRDDRWGDAIGERAPDGTFRTVYRTWDDPTLAASEAEIQDGQLTHANALEVDEAAGAYVLNLAVPQLLVRVDRATGLPAWHAHGTLREFAAADGDTPPISLSHGFQVLPDDPFLYFQNSDPPAAPRSSGAPAA